MSYNSFALVYDVMMSDVDYRGWADYIERLWLKFGKSPELVLDLGCGTGTMCVILAEKGYDVIGIDSSLEMLSIAKDKTKNLDKVLLLNQPMEAFELYGTVDGIISVFDSINYIMEQDELKNVFALAYNYLNPGGMFVFDVNTRYKYKHILADNTFAETFDKTAYIWENYYDDEERINEYSLTLFIEANGQYERSNEYHYQRAYSLDMLKRTAVKEGFRVAGVYDAYSFESPKRTSERVFFALEKE